jgi:CubicO group peptidase (beta-lactamase class C family)
MLDFDRLCAGVGDFVDKARIPALALGIVVDGELAHGRGFGRTRKDGGGEPVNVDSIFPACSTAKSLTATAIMRLVEGGVLDLDRPVIETIPRLRYPAGGYARQVTLRHLLSHSSGLSSDPDLSPRFNPATPDCLREHVELDIPTFRAVAPPGEVSWYSNPGFSIAGHASEVATGTDFATLTRQLVFEPFEMNSTSYDASFRPGREPVEFDARSGPLPVPHSAGGAVTSVADLARFAACHMSSVNGEALLGAELRTAMQTPHADAYCRRPRRYGLRFTIDSHRGVMLVAHGGGGRGCGSTFVMVPEQRAAVIVLFNHPAGHGVSATAILDRLLGLRDPDQVEKQQRDRDTPVRRVGACIRVRGLAPASNGVTTVAFPPGGQFAMFNDANIGLVSCWPYKRES